MQGCHPCDTSSSLVQRIFLNMKTIKYKLHIVNDKQKESIPNIYTDTDSFLLVKGPKINFKLTFLVTALPRQIIMSKNVIQLEMNYNLTV